MKVGIAGPMTLRLLDFDFQSQGQPPIGYDFPMTALLVNAMIRRGHQVVAFTTSIGLTEPVIYSREDLVICVAPRGPHPGRNLFRFERRALTQMMNRHPVDVLHAHWSYEFAWAALDTGLPTLVTVHDHAWSVLRYQFNAYRLVRLLMNYVVLRRAVHLSAVSPHIYGHLSRNIRERTRVIPNFYSRPLDEHFSKPSRKARQIVSVSNGFGRIKNIENALKAFSLIRRREVELQYLLVGEDMEPGGPAHNFAVRNSLADGVSFVGLVPYSRVIELVTSSLVFLHPSRQESFGVSVLEAMALGTPVVAGKRSGNMPFLLNDGDAGMLCDVNSPDDIARCVLSLLDDDQLAAKLGEKARQLAQTRYSEEAVVKAYEASYQDILEGKKFSTRP